MNEYDPYVQSIDSVAPSLAVTSLDDNPDAGARALKLAKATGAPPQVVYNDLDGFDQGHKAALVSHIVRNNPAIASYIRGNPLADVVSNDDYGNLDNFSRSVPNTSILHPGWMEKYITKPVVAGVVGAAESIRQTAAEYLEKPETTDEQALRQLRQTSPGTAAGLQIQSNLLDAATLLGKFAMGPITEGPAKAAGQLAKELGQDPDRAEREMSSLLQSEFMRTGENLHEVAEIGERQAAMKSREAAIAAAKPWIDAGLEPPRGLHPEIDKAKADLNSHYIDQFDANLADAQTSLTRDRDPEYFQKFAEQHYGDSTIGIAGDRVAELYGDRLPSPDDGLLGWVPGIEAKLEEAKLGEDVHVPLADWMTKVDPKVAKDLHDDLRVWPGGITAREAAEPWEAKPVVEAPIAQARAASGTEPMFAIGDRKLELKQQPSIPGFEYAHEYQFLDQDGKPAGELTIIPDEAKKELYISNINGLAGLYSNSFGPSLVRDLTRQLKEIYPQFLDEKGRLTVTGHRVSGARETAGTWETDLAHPVVKLATDDSQGFNNLQDLLNDKFLENHGGGVFAEPSDILKPRQQEVAQAVKEEVQRISGVAPEIVGRIYTAEGGYPLGVYFPDTGRIIVDLFSNDPIGYGRHEAIHHLYRQGFFKPEEWTGLINAARSEGWLDRYGIKDRYSDLDLRGQYEESIAEAYRDWASRRDEIEQPQTLVTQAFEKLRQLWEGIQTRLKEIFGRELSPDELFKRVESGKVAGREGGVQAGGPSFAMPPEDMKAKLDNLRASAAGLDSKTFERMQKSIQTRFQEDIAASLKRAERDQAKTQTKEWKENSKEIAKEVESTIRQRPDVMADLFVGSGEIGGKKIRQVIPLRSDDLTAEQKSALPRRYHSADGLPVDGVAKMVGFTSGDAMVEKLIEYNRDRGDMTSQEHLKKVIADETNRQMEAKFGDLQKNIMLDAQDQALSENNLNLLAEEWQGAAMQAGVKVIDKDFAKAHALEIFSKMEVGTVDSGRLMTQMAKHYRDAVAALAAGDTAKALPILQRRYEVGLLAAEAKKLEKEKSTFDRTAKQFAKREVPSVDPEYTGFIHGILMQVGKSVRRSIQDLQKHIESGESKSLEEFVSNKQMALREVPVWDQLFDQSWRKNVDALTTEEFRNVHNSIKTLVHNGRDELKIYKQGEAADYAEVKKGLINNIADSVGKEIRLPKKPGLLRGYLIKNLQMENIFNRWDAFDAKGLWNQYVMRDLIDGANQVDAWKKEYAAKIKDLGVPEGLNKTLDNPLFKDMDTETPIAFTRKNLISVMLNTGTKSNLVKLAKGYGRDPGEVMNWIHEHATAEDWRFVQGIWDIFKDIKIKSDTMYRSLTGGVPAEDVAVTPVQTKFGTVPGGYYPIIFHSEMEGKSKKLMGRDPLEQENFIRATTPAGYTKSRTGYIAPLALDLDQMPGRISQMLHDIGLRPAVLNASKVFYDKDVRSAVRKYYGDEYKQEMIPYLQSVANSANRDNRSQAAFTRASEFIRQNMITTLVGLNPGTVLKHGPSALVTSIREVGGKEFAKAVSGLFRINESTGESNWQFAIQNSLELQRRDRNWQETLYGAAGGLNPGDKFPEWRQRIMEWSSKPVAISDMLSAVPTWMAAYEKEMGQSGVHGDAIYAADRAVRRAHGSTAITSRTAIQRDWNPWLTSVYNYFSDIMNRQMETIWKAGAALDLAKGDKKAALATVPALTASLFAYAVWPALVEHMVSPSDDNEKDSWAKKVGKQILFTAASSWPGVRDIVTAMIHGKDPQYGLTGTALQEVSNVARDFTKDHPFAKEHAGRLIQDATSFVGAITGMVPAQIGKSARFIHGVGSGVEHPKTVWAWLTGLRFGTNKGHSTSVENYIKGANR
jgi:hypothetical protein